MARQNANSKPNNDDHDHDDDTATLFGRAFDEAVHGEINVARHSQRILSLLEEHAFKLLVKQSLEIFRQPVSSEMYSQIIANIILMGYDTGRAESALLAATPAIDELEKLVLLGDVREDPYKARLLDAYKLPE